MTDKMPEVIYANDENEWCRTVNCCDGTSYTRTDIHEAEVKRLREALVLARKYVEHCSLLYCMSQNTTLTAIDAALDGGKLIIALKRKE